MEVDPDNGITRRRYIRVVPSKREPVWARFYRYRQKVLFGRVENISRGGLALFGSLIVPDGERFDHIDILLPPDKAVSLTGVAKRCVFNRAQNQYCIAVQFEDVPLGAEISLNEYIRQRKDQIQEAGVAPV